MIRGVLRQQCNRHRSLSFRLNGAGLRQNLLVGGRRSFSRSGNEFQGRPVEILLGNGDAQGDGRRRIRKGLLVGVGTGTLVLGLYVYFQIRWKQKMCESCVGTGNESVFVPLWVNPNWLYRSAYKFPKAVQYFDPEFYKYVVQEIEQVCEDTELEPMDNPSLTTHIHNYYMGEEALKFMQVFVNTNVKYKVLEELLKNVTIRRLFGLPLSVDIIDYRRENFRVWVESKYPTVSGIEVPMKDWRSWLWTIHPVNWHTWANNLANEWALSRERRSDIPTDHIQEAGVDDSRNLRHNHGNSVDGISGSRNYSIVYTGEFLVRDHHLDAESWLYYKGIIDFDHLLINRGVQLVELDLIIKHNNELVKYKIL